MPFVFTVEDGTGLPTANAYVSVTDADDILVTNIHATAWQAKTTPEKEKLLAWATRLLDTKATWYGTKTYETSGLRWPRTGVTDRDGVALADDEIPQRLKEATAEMARALVEVDRTTERSQDALKALKVDVVELEFDSNYRLPQVPKTVWEILSDLGYFGVSTGAAKIIRV